ADQVLWLADAGVCVDEDVAVSKLAGREHRDGDEAPIALAQHHRVGGEREFADVELGVARLAAEKLAMLERKVVQRDAVGCDGAVREGGGAVVRRAGERQVKLHDGTLAQPPGSTRRWRGRRRSGTRWSSSGRCRRRSARGSLPAAPWPA